MIAHNYAQVLEICDRVNLLQHGTIVLDKPASPELMDELTELVMREYRIGAAGS
jgi:ABC-type sugar transport system ATPase subunit